VTRHLSPWAALGVLVPCAVSLATQAQPAGSVRGVIYDEDFDAPLPAATVTIVELGRSVTATDEGTFSITDVPPGRYTVVFSKDGYARQVRADVIVTTGQLTDLDARLSGDFTDLEPFVVEEVRIGGTEAALLELRFEVPQLLDSVSAELISRAGASDAAAALTLVSGATVQDGKFAVIRGLPDRFVVSQINGVRLPSADADTRAVELDQFPSAIIESIQVSKTFTPDQQGDASGGTVNVVLKGVPRETILEIKGSLGYNTQVADRGDFLTYAGGGVNFLANDRGTRDMPVDPADFGGAAGVSRGTAPGEYKWSAALGGGHEFDSGVRIGGFASFFYDRGASFHDNGIDDRYWQRNPGEGLVPRTIQGTPEDGDFKTSLFDVSKGSQSVQWGGLLSGAIESENHTLAATYLYTRDAEDSATLAEDTRGKEYFFPGYDPDDIENEGNLPDNRTAAPYLRTETLEYEERTTETFILRGDHRLPVGRLGIDDFLTVEAIELDWTVSRSEATLYRPDKRQFGQLWLPRVLIPGIPPFFPETIVPPLYQPFKPAAVFSLGNFQRIYETIIETSDQRQANVTIPFEQWTDSEGFLKFGVFNDEVVRTFDQETFSNFGDNAGYEGDWDDSWSQVFPTQGRTISDGPPFVDVDYRGEQRISAWYGMMELPIWEQLSIIGGARLEETRLSIVNTPEQDATYFPPGATAPVALTPGAADVDFRQSDVLPSIGFRFEPLEWVTLRGSYAETLARQTFKELTPIQQQEFLGGSVFIGNPDLVPARVENLDFRLDLTPVEGGLVSVSWFRKDIEDVIENVQRIVGNLDFTFPVNYPTGRLQGWEFEVRQDMGRVWDRMEGLSLGANATLIDSAVTLPEEEAAALADVAIQAPMPVRDATGAPEFLYNLFLTYDLEPTGTSFSVFYTVQGDTLREGAGVDAGNFVPNVYALEYGTLNMGITQKIGPYVKVSFQARNLTNPEIQEVYRSEYVGGDVLKTSFTRGIDYSIGVSANFTF
jgi:outer membrane receptor protein involved in Fe transport